MATTRRGPPLQIFQDPVDALDDFASFNGLGQGALIDSTSPQSLSFDPLYSIPSGLSPVKTSRHSSSPPAKALADKTNLNAVVFPPPPSFVSSTDSPMKRAAPYNSAMATSNGYDSKPFQQQHYTSIYPRVEIHTDKENMHAPSAMNAKNQTLAGVPSKKATHKRKLTDSAPLAPVNANGPSKKQKIEQIVLPAPEDMPIIEDDGGKPPYSYAQLIGMAILRAPNRRLTLASIYNWISTSFSFYQAGDAGWQNSIRHNLSLNKAFYKQERPKDDPGKGNYWAIVSGMELQFMKEKPRRNTLSSESGPYIYSSANELPRPMTSSSNANFASESNFVKRMDSNKYPDDAELSSDATIPASDPGIHDGIDPPAESFMMPPPARTFRSSPPPVDIRSSPPPVPEREDTPPPQVRHRPSSRPSGGRKRKFGGLGDSGYYSSIESSATRVRFLTSEVDRDHPAMKRGRAEEEIMRMRSSSIDISPTKANARLDAGVSFSSSPFKPMDTLGRKDPLTPAVVFRKPNKPPMSVSPGTNLKHHREHVRQLLGSPNKTMNIWEDSPLKLPGLDLPNAQFEIFANETGADAFSGAFNDLIDENYLASSPLKSAKRPRMDRSVTSTDVLHDVFGGRLGSPFGDNTVKSDFKMKLLGSPARIASPAKREQITSHPLEAPTSIPHMALPDIPEEDDFMFAVNLPSDDSDGLDISKGFQKIGATKPHAPSLTSTAHLMAPPPTNASWMKSYGSPSKPPTNARPHGRPSLGRSTTSMF